MINHKKFVDKKLGAGGAVSRMKRSDQREKKFRGFIIEQSKGYSSSSTDADFFYIYRRNEWWHQEMTRVKWGDRGLFLWNSLRDHLKKGWLILCLQVCFFYDLNDERYTKSATHDLSLIIITKRNERRAVGDNDLLFFLYGVLIRRALFSHMRVHS